MRMLRAIWPGAKRGCGQRASPAGKHRVHPFVTASILLALTACAGSPAASATPAAPGVSTATTPAQAALPTTTAQSAGACRNDAAFVEDLTVPDGTLVEPGQLVDKRWAVINSGTCDWGPDYRLRPIAGNPLVGGRAEALFPARAGEEAIWRVTFEAPAEPGEYIGQWQAFDPAGTPFGDTVFLVLEVEGD